MTLIRKFLSIPMGEDLQCCLQSCSNGRRRIPGARKARPLTFALVLLMAVSLLWLTSCASSKSDYAFEPPAYPGDAAPAPDAGRGGQDYRDSTGGAGESAVRYRIRTGSLDLVVTSTHETVEKIKQVAAGAGGYISESYIRMVKDDLYHANMTLRVPENRFDAVMDQLRGMGKFSNERTNDDDVTMRYLDLEARIKNLEAQEERLREILAMAKTVEDVLNVERDLQRVRGEIESMTVQFKHLKDQVNFSTITIGLREEHIATTAVSPAPFANLGGRMKEALVRSINYILAAVAGLLVALIALLPVAVVLGPAALVLWLIISRLSRRRTPPAAGGQ